MQSSAEYSFEMQEKVSAIEILGQNFGIWMVAGTAGLILLVWGLVVYGRRRWRHSPTQDTAVPEIDGTSSGEGFELVDRTDTWSKVGVLLLINGFWWGMVYLMYWKSDGGIYSSIFSGVFAVAGLLLVYGLVVQTLTVWHLEPGVLTVTSWPISLGQTIPVRFERAFKKAVDVTRVEATLRCREVARYQRGTDVHEAQETVYDKKLPEFSPPPGVPMVRHQWEVSIPQDGAPSFEAHRNEILWELVVNLSINGSPDDDSVFPLWVRPVIHRD